MCGGSQVVRQEAATLSCAGAIPARRFQYSNEEEQHYII